MKRILSTVIIPLVLSFISVICYASIIDMKDTDSCTIESVGHIKSHTLKISNITLQRGVKCTYRELKSIYLRKGEYIKARNNRTKQRFEILSKHDVPSASNSNNNFIRTRGAYSKGTYELSAYFEEDPILYMVEDTIFIPADIIFDDYNWVNIKSIPGNYEILSGYDKESKELIITKSDITKKIKISELDKYKFHLDYHSANPIRSYPITDNAKIIYINPIQ